MSTTIAQAFVEKGLIDGTLTRVGNAIDIVGLVLHDQPWLVLIVAITVGLVIYVQRRY